MGVNKDGNGEVNTWDSNGYPLTDLKSKVQYHAIPRETGIYCFGWSVDAGWHIGGGVVLATGSAKGKFECTGISIRYSART